MVFLVVASFLSPVFVKLIECYVVFFEHRHHY